MGNPFVHFELSTTDASKAKSFYKKLFDWKITDLPSMSYSMIDSGQKDIGGGITAISNQGQPPAWLPYIEVADVKKTLAKAAKAGAKVALAYQEIGEMGAIGVFIDPTGAMLGVWQKANAKAGKKAGKKSDKKADKKAKKASKASADEAGKKTDKKSGKKSGKKTKKADKSAPKVGKKK